RHIADIGIGQEPSPAPAIRTILENLEDLAMENFRFDTRPGFRTPLQGRGKGADRTGSPGHETRCLHPAAQGLFREIRPEDMQPGIERAHGCSARCRATTRSPRRSTAS